MTPYQCVEGALVSPDREALQQLPIRWFAAAGHTEHAAEMVQHLAKMLLDHCGSLLSQAL
jgi:hypothetical protein